MPEPADARSASIHAPRQARSRETLTRLLDATEAVLRESGLESATVPAIAARAGLSVGAVYRRFPDKDALLRAVHERTFVRLRELNASRVDPGPFAGAGLAAWVGGMIRGMVHVYRQDRRLIQAMLQYGETHTDAEFRARAAETNQAALARFVDMIEAKAGEVRHPAPENAARFALVTMGLVLRGLILADHAPAGLALGDETNLEDELTRLVLGYLGVEGGAGAGAAAG
ncbi:MAG TPA: TetR/AcrR family transcriptional regulator [Longimicrobium sp.]|nr:TetR/AcrR family transcriptional regulator [Longimicrobium sp.]